jgi:hypothetical protein
MQPDEGNSFALEPFLVAFAGSMVGREMARRIGMILKAQ